MTRPAGELRPFLGRIELSGDASSKSSWIQLCEVGNWWDDRYGDFNLTREDLAQMLSNFDNVMPKKPTKLPMDYNHGTQRPTTAELGKASGWISQLELRAEGDQLWGFVEWTDPAADMIAAKEYQFVSPVFRYNYKHSNGQEIGTTLLSAALTNRPVLEGMAPVSLSLSHPTARTRTPEEIAAMSKDLKTVKDASGKDVQLSAEVIAAIVKDHAPAGSVELTKQIEVAVTAATAPLKTLLETQSETIKELGKKNDALELARKTDGATAKVDALVRAGKVLPKERDGLIQLAVKDETTFELVTKDRPQIVKLNHETGSSGGGSASPNAEVEAAVQAELTADPKLSKEQAFDRACKKNPKIYELAQAS